MGIKETWYDKEGRIDNVFDEFHKQVDLKEMRQQGSGPSSMCNRSAATVGNGSIFLVKVNSVSTKLEHNSREVVK